MTLALRAMTQFANWPDLVEAPATCGTGLALRTARVEIAHFHSGRAVDLHLTVRAIRRLQDNLTSSTAIRLTPGSPWVTVRLEGNADVDLLMTLMSLALQIHQAEPDPGDLPPARCSDHDGAGIPPQPVGGG